MTFTRRRGSLLAFLAISLSTLILASGPGHAIALAGPSAPTSDVETDWDTIEHAYSMDSANDAAISENLGNFYVTHPYMLGTDNDLTTMNTDLTQAGGSESTYADILERYGAMRSVKTIDSDAANVDIPSLASEAGNTEVAAEAGATAGLSDAGAGLLADTGPIGLTVIGIGFGLKWEWGALGGNHPSTQIDTYYTTPPVINADQNVNAPCDFEIAGHAAITRPCTVPDGVFHGDFYTANLGCQQGPCGVNLQSTAEVASNGQGSSSPLLPAPVQGALPGNDLTLGNSSTPDPGDQGYLDYTFTNTYNQGGTFTYNACTSDYPHQCDVGIQLLSHWSDTQGVFLGLQAAGTQWSAANQVNRWTTYQERCFEPGQHVFDYYRYRGPLMSGTNPGGSLSISPCPTDSVTGHPGNLVGVKAFEMPSATKMLDWEAPPKLLDQNDPYYSCEAGNASGTACAVHPSTANTPVTSDTGTNPCLYGSTPVAEADCVLADPATWTKARTTTRTKLKLKPDGTPDTDPDTNPSSAPSDEPSDQPSASPSAGGVTDPTNTHDSDPNYDTNLAPPDGGGSCTPSGWAIFNPFAWVYKPVICALRKAFEPSGQALQEWSGQIDALQATAPVATGAAATNFITAVTKEHPGQASCNLDANPQNPLKYCAVLNQAADYAHSSWGSAAELLAKLAIGAGFAFYWYNRLTSSIGGKSEL